MSKELFYNIGCEYINYNSTRSLYVGRRKFLAHFGVPALICEILWDKLGASLNFKPKHLLWALLFLKTYNTEHVMSTILKTDEKTLRKYVWMVVDALANLNLVFI